VLVFRLSHSGLAVSALVLAEIVPTLLLGPLAGVVIDRLDRRRVLMVVDTVRAILVLALALTHALWTVYLLAALLAVGSTLFNPALQAVIPALLTEEERVAANSVAWSSGRLVQIIGASVAGGLIAWAGTTPAFLINAASFAFSAVMLARLSIPARQGPSRGGGLAGWLRDAGEGLVYARRDPFIARLVPVQALTSLATGATSALLVVLATTHLHLAAQGFGWLLAAIGVGALLGPFLSNRLTGDRYLDMRLLFDGRRRLPQHPADGHPRPGARACLHVARRHLGRDAPALPGARRPASRPPGHLRRLSHRRRAPHPRRRPWARPPWPFAPRP